MNTKHKFPTSEANSEFKSYVLEGLNTILIGVPSIDDVNIDDISVILNGCRGDTFYNKRAEIIANMEKLHSRLLRLPFEGRNTVMQYIDHLKKKGIIRPHIGQNFWAVLNFLSSYYHSSISHIIASDLFVENIFIDDCRRYIEGDKAITRALDDITKLRKTAKPGGTNLSKINQFCSSFLITPSVLYKGEGYFYTLSIPENITKDQANRFYLNLMNRIAEEVQKEDAGCDINIKELILQDGVVSESDIDEWVLKTHSVFWYIPSREVTKINEMLNTR